jgi:hypothetical protein
VPPINGGKAFGVAAGSIRSAVAAAGGPPFRAGLLDDPADGFARQDFVLRVL